MIPSINLVFFSFGWMAAIEIVTLYITIDMPVVRTQIETVGEFTQVFPYINIFFFGSQFRKPREVCFTLNESIKTTTTTKAKKSNPSKEDQGVVGGFYFLHANSHV